MKTPVRTPLKGAKVMPFSRTTALGESRLAHWDTAVQLHERTEQCQLLYEEVQSHRRLHEALVHTLHQLDLTPLRMLVMARDGSDPKLIQFVTMVRHLVGVL